MITRCGIAANQNQVSLAFDGRHIPTSRAILISSAGLKLSTFGGSLLSQLLRHSELAPAYVEAFVVV